MEDAIPGKLSAGREKDGRKAGNPSSVLDRVHEPADLKALSREQLVQLCAELREFIIEVVSQKGGHLGASLGVIELTVALHAILDLPSDRLVWDTGHQAYPHKVLTGRREQLWTIRQHGGISGFLKRGESEFDAFGAGHASTAISAALGMASARDLAGKDHHVVAVLGDGAMTGGLAYEAVNNAGQARSKLLVVLNDNGMSIAPNVGAISHYLTHVTSNPHLKKLRDESLQLLRKVPAVGEPIGDLAQRLESTARHFLVPGGLFESLGFSYHGPVDGHDLDELMKVLPNLVDRDGPVLLHVVTRKGKGLALAEADHESYHGVKPFDKETGQSLGTSKAGGTPSYTKVFGDAMLQAAEAFPRMVAITAAMPTGTGLSDFQKMHPKRFFDVGIAEAHGICFAAGLACDGARPVATIYSTFLQRAYDQIVHDVAIQRLPVVFAMDRAGLVGADGPTHHGTLDLSYMRSVPGMRVSAPKDGNELRDLLWTALSQDEAPFALRYPRGNVPAGFDPQREPRVLPIGSWERLADGRDLAFLAVGTMVQTALEARGLLEAGGVSAAVVNCRFVKPMDADMLRELRAAYAVLVTVEENGLPGGFGEGVLDELDRGGHALAGVVRLGLPDAFVTHGSRDELLAGVGLTANDLMSAALRGLGKDR